MNRWINKIQTMFISTSFLLGIPSPTPYVYILPSLQIEPDSTILRKRHRTTQIHLKMITLSKPLMHDPVLPCPGAVLILTDSSVNVHVPWGQAWSFLSSLSLWPSAQWLLSKCLLNRDCKWAFARMNKWINVSLVLMYCNRKLFCLLRDVFIYDLSFFCLLIFFPQEIVSPRAKAALYCFSISHNRDRSAEKKIVQIS